MCIYKHTLDSVRRCDDDDTLYNGDMRRASHSQRLWWRFLGVCICGVFSTVVRDVVVTSVDGVFRVSSSSVVVCVRACVRAFRVCVCVCAARLYHKRSAEQITVVMPFFAFR